MRFGGPPPCTHVALWIAPDADAGRPVDVRRKLAATLVLMSLGWAAIASCTANHPAF
jgi:hypothetical protein